MASAGEAGARPCAWAAKSTLGAFRVPCTIMGGESAAGSPWSYDVVGYHGGDFGLAIAARQTVGILRAMHRPVREIGMDAAPGGSSPATGRSVALFQANPLEIAQHAPQWQEQVARGARNACVPFWELPLVPRSWESILRAMDVILAPSRFIEEACIRVAGAERVLHYPQSVDLPRDVVACREAWGLSPTATLFIVSFDLGSGVDRKNPWGAIEAFRSAFPGGEDVQLVVKTRPWPEVREFSDELERLRGAAADPRIRIVAESLPYADVLRLYASCDVLVSLHRSEGLGLHLLEAMGLGKVVVATGWSGNTDFMTAENSVPVGYSLVAIEPTHPHYVAERGRPGQVWAEPDVGAAARAMRELHDSPARRLELGRRAATDMASRRASGLSGATFEALEERLGSLPGRSLGAAVWRTRWRLTARGWRRELGLP